MRSTANYLMQDLLTFRSSDAKRMWRELIFTRDNWRCQYCGSTENLTIDHIRPKCKAGPTNADNCCTACITCNQAKGSMSIDSFIEQLLPDNKQLCPQIIPQSP